MDWTYAVIIILVVIYCLYKIFMQLIKKKSPDINEDKPISINEKLPYRTKDCILTDTEMKFYRVLILALNNRAFIAPKIGLKDFLFINKSTGEYMKFFGKISSKHIDFLLCDIVSMKPLCGIELDDSSHESEKTQKRDTFVQKVYNDADLPLLRFKTKPSYSKDEIITQLTPIMGQSVKSDQSPTVLCPKCDIPMVIRMPKYGGKKFYGCKNYPNCKETINTVIE